MNLEEGRELLRRCQRDRQSAREALQVAQATVESCQLIIEGVLKRFPELAADEQEWGELWGPGSLQRPRGAEAVLSVLQVAEERWFTIAELVEALDKNGWLPESGNPPNAVRAAVERLVTSGANVEKSRYDGVVTYRYREEDEEPL